MPDLDVILDRLPRHLVWVCAGCDDCAPLDGSPRSPTPCDGPSQNGAWVIEVADAESAVRDARDATVQEIVELREELYDHAAPTIHRSAWLEGIAYAFNEIERRFPNGGTHDG